MLVLLINEPLVFFLDELIIIYSHQIETFEFVKLPIAWNGFSVFLLLDLVHVRVAIQEFIVHVFRYLIQVQVLVLLQVMLWLTFNWQTLDLASLVPTTLTQVDWSLGRRQNVCAGLLEFSGVEQLLAFVVNLLGEALESRRDDRAAWFLLDVGYYRWASFGFSQLLFFDLWSWITWCQVYRRSALHICWLVFLFIALAVAKWELSLLRVHCFYRWWLLIYLVC